MFILGSYSMYAAKCKNLCLMKTNSWDFIKIYYWRTEMPEKLHHLAFKLATLCSSGESSSNSRPENDNPKQQNANKMLY